MMPTRQLTQGEIKRALAAVKKWGSIAKAAKKLGMARTTLDHQVKRSLTPEMVPVVTEDMVRDFIRREPRSIPQICKQFGLSAADVEKHTSALLEHGYNVFFYKDTVSIEKRPIPRDGNSKSELYEFESDANGEYVFGVVSDNHLGSKYAREDVLYDLYDWFADNGVKRVYNAGNWIDGEARFNKFDLKVHGMQAQLDYFCEKYPSRKGIHTYYVAGDDHEGWYCKDAGVDIGLMAEQTARDKYGRTDLHYLGYMESYIALRHKRTRCSSQLMVVHPGGGSSYAISYAPQKFAEALQGGEKPAVIIFGHWHKMDVFNYRNVWLIQAGTTEDQTPFMRKQKLEAHVGGLIVRLKQDARGAIMECTTTQKRYFDRGYHNGSFSMSGPVSHPPLKKKA